MKRTKTKLVSSIVTLLICFAMLIGSTFAWFTDSASTGVNTIQAGNLDVEFYRGEVNPNQKITSDTKLFDKDVYDTQILWEPGVVSVEKLIVVNEGNLALKFKMGISNLVGGINYNYVIEAGQNTPTEKSLLDVLYVYTSSSDINSTTARGLSASDGITLKNFISDNNFLSGKLEHNGDSAEVNVAIYWPQSSLDNEYNINNGRTVSSLEDGEQTDLVVHFPVTLAATQLTSESDSFDNQYDATATYPFVLPESTATIVDTPTTPFYSDYDGSSPSQITVDNDTKLQEKVTVTTNNATSINLNVEYTYGGTTVHKFSEVREKTYPLSKNLSNVTVSHSNESISMRACDSIDSYNSTQDTAYFYDSQSGILYIKSSMYSTFTVTYTHNFVAVVDGEGYSNLGDAINAAKDGDTIVLLDNISVSNTPIEVQEGVEIGKTCISIQDKGITIDGNGKVINLRANDPAGKTYGIYITGSNSLKTVTIKNAKIITENLERAIRTYDNIGFKIENSTITTNGVGIHVKGANTVEICDTQITVNAIDAYSAHKRAGVVVGGPDANVTVDECTIKAINNDINLKDTTTWCKGLYVGNSAKNGVLTVNNTKVEADFSIGIDGTGDIDKPSIIKINSGEYSGIIGSPSGGSYKSLIINGGIFTGIQNYKDFYGKDNSVAKLVISGGKFDVLPDSKYIETGKTTIKGEGLYRVVDPTTEVESKQGVTISGIAGVADSYDTIQDAYEDVKAMLVANSGLAEQPLSEESFNAFFTDGGKITWTIYGNQEVTYTRMFSFGREANRFGEGRHITEINIVGGNSSASLDLNAVNGTFALPYNWWNVADSVNTTLKCKNITFNGIKSMPSATYQCTLYPTTYEFDGCTFNGNLYSYQNFDVNMTIKNCTFNAPADTQYALHSQGKGGTITLDNNVFNNYTRGINLERATADFVITNNTIRSTVSEPDRGAIQLTDGKSFVVTGNKVSVNAGNAFWFHNAATNANVTYTISNNDIKAPYIGYSGVTAFDVNTKITSSGNNFNSTDTTKCMKKNATVAEETNLTAIR